MTDTSNVSDHADRFVSKLSDLTITDKDGNLKWDRGVRHVDGNPFRSEEHTSETPVTL